MFASSKQACVFKLRFFVEEIFTVLYNKWNVFTLKLINQVSFRGCARERGGYALIILLSTVNLETKFYSLASGYPKNVIYRVYTSFLDKTLPDKRPNLMFQRRRFLSIQTREQSEEDATGRFS